MKTISHYIKTTLSTHALRDVAGGLVEAVEAGPDSYLGAWFAAHLFLSERETGHYSALIAIVQKAARVVYGQRKGNIPMLRAGAEYYLHVGGFRNPEINEKLFEYLKTPTRKVVKFSSMVRGTEYDPEAFHAQVTSRVFALEGKKVATLDMGLEVYRARVARFAQSIENSHPGIAEALRNLDR